MARNEVVHHKNGKKDDNELENLEVMSLSEHSRQHNLGRLTSDETKQKISEALMGHKAPNRKFTEDQVEQIRMLHENGVSNRQIAQMFNANHQTINDLIKGKTYKN